MENYYFLILVAVVGVIRWFLQAAENKKNTEAQKRSGQAPPATGGSSPAPKRAAPQSEEERVRKFFEALGLPSSETPPPRVQPRVTTPKPAAQNRKFLPVDPFPVPSARPGERSAPPASVPMAPPPLPPMVPVAVAPFPEVKASRLPSQTGPVAVPDPWAVTPFGSGIEELSSAETGVHSDSGAAALAARLATPQGLRDAIILREIFGPPRGLQPLAGAAVD